jgi:beta-1,2-mannobiose phosphorylase / 1,2-beta-oligomannan phosphorylase
MSTFQLKRIGVIMEPEAGNPHEIEGVLNPGATRGRDGKLYLFPRLVSRGNYSRIGIARVRFNSAGDPEGVERLGIALEPKERFEARGCEDPRVTYVEPLDRYVMAYTAFSSEGPRIALAISDDLFQWERLGLATFQDYRGIAFEGVNNKDASVFPVAVPDPYGQLSMAILQRPLFKGTRPEDIAGQPSPRLVDRDHESIWISYCSTAMSACAPLHLCHFGQHHRLATPVADWERLKIGGGTPPILTRHGWLTIYHGVSEHAVPQGASRELCYSAGVLVLSHDYPQIIRYRSPEPVLKPELMLEREGVVANVVFPTAVDQRVDIGQPDRIDVYYGMADQRIGVARLDIPAQLPMAALAHASDERHN